jgi:2-oxoisovalerate dehydrogenase E2 component (dihydrolipoyl transacylase)
MKIELPQVGESVTEGVIGRWLKNIGESVEKYDPLVEVVTDKVNMEMPSPVSGVLTNILAEEGQTVPMGAVIAEIQVEGEEIDTTGVLLKDVAPVGPTGSGGPVSVVQEDSAEQRPRQRYSPAVLRLAQEHNVDLTLIAGTGISGRITRKDVQVYIDSAQQSPEVVEPTPVETTVSAAPAAGATSDEERVPLTPIRRMIAENMVKSSTQIPQAWTLVEVDVTDLVRRRALVREDFQNREGVNLTYLPFVVKAVAEALKDNPLMNSSWDGDAIVLKRRLNIGIAVSAGNGLVVPVIHDAETLSIAGLAKKIDELTNKARQGTLELQDVQGGTFTLNNTGALGSVLSRPLVNYPQAGILTTETIVKRPVVIEDAIAIRSMMNITLTFDHRIMDGSEASAFVNAVKQRLEAIGPDTGVY